MEGTKTHICTPANRIVKLSKFDSINIYANGTIEGIQNFGDYEETETLFQGTPEEAEKVMEKIKEALCI